MLILKQIKTKDRIAGYENCKLCFFHYNKNDCSREQGSSGCVKYNRYRCFKLVPGRF